MAQFSIVEFILQDLLRISSDLIRDYASVQDQLLWLILVPHAVLLLFVYIFSDSISRMAIPGPGPHQGFKIIFGVVSYITIIMTGWYGEILVPVFILWWQLALIVALILFSMTKILVHPAALPHLVKGAAVATSGITGKHQDKKAIKKELRLINEQIARLTPLASTGNPFYTGELSRITARKAELEAKLASL